MEIIRSFWTALKAAASPLTAFLTGTTLVCCGYASLNSTFALQLNLSDTPMFVSGLVLACYYLGSITASLSAYKFINKVGNIRAFSAFTSLLSALVLLHVFTGNLFLWPFLRFGEGYCIGTINLCLESWLNTRATNKNRGLVMSLYMVTTYLGASIGQLSLNIPDPSGTLVYILISIIFSIALIPVSLTALPAPNIQIFRSTSVREAFKISPVGFACCIVSGILVGSFYLLGTIYASSIGMSIKDVSMFMFFGVFGGLLALIVMWALLRSEGKFCSLLGVSVAGAAAHNIGQVIAAIIWMQTDAVVAYLPLLLVMSVPLGLVTGLTCAIVLSHMKKINFNV